MERTPNKSQHVKLTLEKKILPPLLPGLELATFRSRVRRSHQQATPAKAKHGSVHTARETVTDGPCTDSRNAFAKNSLLLRAHLHLQISVCLCGLCSDNFTFAARKTDGIFAATNQSILLCQKCLSRLQVVSMMALFNPFNHKGLYQR